MIGLADLIRISGRQIVSCRKWYCGAASAITLGTCGLIVVMTMGRDIKTNVNRDLDLLGGATMIRAFIRRDIPGARFNCFEDATVEQIRGHAGVSMVSRAAAKEDQAATFVDGERIGFMLHGVDEDFWNAFSFEPYGGRFFTAEEMRNRDRVCVLGAALGRRIFGDKDPVGQSIQIDRDWYSIVGLLDGPGVGGWNHFAFIPIMSAMDRIEGLSPLNRLYVRCRTWDDVRPVADWIPSVVGGHQSAAGLWVEVAWAQLDKIRSIAWWVDFFVQVSLGATFCLGGTGIWYSMLLAVRSRTREIGLKKASGATNKDIMKEFLTEAVCLSTGSAIIGLAMGHVAMLLIARFLDSVLYWPMFAASAGWSLLMAMALGIGAGFYPSMKAAHMEVVSAIRYE